MAERDTRELAGCHVAVTGAASGIGRAIALELASAGAAILLHTGSRRDALERTAAEVRAIGADVRTATVDLSTRIAQDGLVETAWSWHAIDVWINNAGVDILTTAAADLTFDQKLERLWLVDVLATVRLSRRIGARMKQRGRGTIINMGWDQAATGMEGDSGEMFATTKGAVMAFSRSLAKSLAPEVRVNCLAPGWIRTAWGARASEAWQERARRESLLVRWGTPEDVAHVCRFLASPAAAFVTGQVINVNGGRA